MKQHPWTALVSMCGREAVSRGYQSWDRSLSGPEGPLTGLCLAVVIGTNQIGRAQQRATSTELPPKRTAVLGGPRPDCRRDVLPASKQRSMRGALTPVRQVPVRILSVDPEPLRHEATLRALRPFSLNSRPLRSPRQDMALFSPGAMPCHRAVLRPVRRFLSASHSRGASRDLLARRGESLAVSPTVPAASGWPTPPKQPPRAGFQGEPRCSVAASQKPGVSIDLSKSNGAIGDRSVTLRVPAVADGRAPSHSRSNRR